MEFYDDPKFQHVAAVATVQARRTGDKIRIYRAYGQYCSKFADLPYDGEHVSFVLPPAEITASASPEVADWLDPKGTLQRAGLLTKN